MHTSNFQLHNKANTTNFLVSLLYPIVTRYTKRKSLESISSRFYYSYKIIRRLFYGMTINDTSFFPPFSLEKNNTYSTTFDRYDYRCKFNMRVRRPPS